MMVYTCRECGEVVQLSDDPQIDRFGLGKMTNE
jgi:DNA-directed RNA polymerase subunit RPC12/RpoP